MKCSLHLAEANRNMRVAMQRQATALPSAALPAQAAAKACGSEGGGEPRCQMGLRMRDNQDRTPGNSIARHAAGLTGRGRAKARGSVTEWSRLCTK